MSSDALWGLLGGIGLVFLVWNGVKPFRVVFRLLVGATLALLLGFGLGFRLNFTASMPIGLYRVHEAPVAPARGELVCLDVHHPKAPAGARSYPGEFPMLKRVVASPGDIVDLDPVSGLVRVNGSPLPCSVSLREDSQHNVLPRPRYPIEVPRGHVWLSSGHARGFDSRYFGAAPVEALTCGSAELLFGWEGEGGC